MLVAVNQSNKPAGSLLVDDTKSEFVISNIPVVPVSIVTDETELLELPLSLVFLQPLAKIKNTKIRNILFLIILIKFYTIIKTCFEI
jgi:hypothetical protein